MSTDRTDGDAVAAALAPMLATTFRDRPAPAPSMTATVDPHTDPHADPIGALYVHATDEELPVLDALMVRAGLHWVCPRCGAHNPTDVTACQNCPPHRREGTR